MNTESKRKVTVEDLLRLKRTERPPGEFWPTFESQIRAKQLAAIVGKRPWWDGASRVFATLRRHSLPVGAAAAVALTWVSVRQMNMASGSAFVAAPRPVPATVAAVQAPKAVRHEALSQMRQEAPAVVAAEPPASVAVGGSAHVVRVPETVAAQAPARSPFADGIAVTLADFRESAPALGQRDVFGSDREFEAPAASVRPQDNEPLSRMDPSAERRARLLAPALPTYASSAARPLATAWMRERGDDDRMYESMDPYGSVDRSVVGFRF